MNLDCKLNSLDFTLIKKTFHVVYADKTYSVFRFHADENKNEFLDESG